MFVGLLNLLETPMIRESLHPFIRYWLALGTIIGLARIAAFVYLEYAESTNTQTISNLPLVLLILPEGSWMDARGMPFVFGVLLLVVSFLAASILVGMVLLIARVARGGKTQPHS